MVSLCFILAFSEDKHDPVSEASAFASILWSLPAFSNMFGSELVELIEEFSLPKENTWYHYWHHDSDAKSKFWNIASMLGNQ